MDWISYPNPDTGKGRVFAIVIKDLDDKLLRVAEYDKEKKSVEVVVRSFSNGFLNISKKADGEDVFIPLPIVEALKRIESNVPKCVKPLGVPMKRRESSSTTAPSPSMSNAVAAGPSTPTGPSPIPIPPSKPVTMAPSAYRKLNIFLTGYSPSECITTFSSLPLAKDCVPDGLVGCTFERGHAMCMAYKSADPDKRKVICNSSRLDTGKDHPVTKKPGVRLSGDAQFVYMPRLSSLELRELSVSSVNIKFKDSAICAACLKDEVLVPYHDMFMNIHRSSEMCGLCKRPHGHHVEDNIFLCKGCKNAVVGESAMYIGLEVLEKVFSSMDIQIKDKRSSGRCSSSSRSVFPDCEIRVMRAPGNVILLFVIEQDENQHKNEKQSDEHEKMMKQAAEAIADLYTTLEPEDRPKVKVILVRFSPSGNFKVDNTYFGKDLGRTYRIIVLRQWIIWAILNAERLGPLNMWYMYYNNTTGGKDKHAENKRATLMFKDWEGFAMIFEAPKPENPAHDWKYCLVPYEGDVRSCRGSKSDKPPKKKKKGKKGLEQVDEKFSGKKDEVVGKGKMFKKMVEARVDVDEVFNKPHGWTWAKQGPEMPRVLKDAVELIMHERERRMA